MAVDSKVVTVGTTATVLHTATGYVKLKVLVPSGGQTLYVGPSDVTADTTAATGGYPVATGTAIDVALEAGESLYGRVAATTQVVNVLVLNN